MATGPAARYPSGAAGPYRAIPRHLPPPPGPYPAPNANWTPNSPPFAPNEPDPTQRQAAKVPSLLVMVGVLLLLTTLVLPWYVVNFSATDKSGTSFSGSLGVYTLDICISGIAQGSGGASANVAQCNYYFSTPGGFLFLVGAILLFVAVMLGVLGGILGLLASSTRGPVVAKRTKRPYRMALWGFVLSLVSVILFYLTSAGNMSELANADCTNAYAGYSGSPTMGSCPFTMALSNGDRLTGTISWAPSYGFLVAAIALVLAFVGMVKLRRYWKDIAPWDPASGLGSPAPTPESQPIPYPANFTALAPHAAPMVNQVMGGDSAAPACPGCGQITTYLPASQSWYCHTCAQLVR